MPPDTDCYSCLMGSQYKQVSLLTKNLQSTLKVMKPNKPNIHNSLSSTPLKMPGPVDAANPLQYKCNVTVVPTAWLVNDLQPYTC
jgi:hypothetical protein